MSRFLRRWSDRKVEARQQSQMPDLDEPLVVPDEPATEDLHRAIPETDEAHPDLAARLAELPPIETISAETDIRPFLQDFVPAALRKAALRRAWLADPVISTHLDVARDYAWDFNAGDGPGGFYRALGREVAQRSLAALKTTRITADPDATGSLPADEATPRQPMQSSPPPEVAETENHVDSRADDDATPHESKAAPRLELRIKHGGALPD